MDIAGVTLLPACFCSLLDKNKLGCIMAYRGNRDLVVFGADEFVRISPISRQEVCIIQLELRPEAEVSCDCVCINQKR